MRGMKIGFRKRSICAANKEIHSNEGMSLPKHMKRSTKVHFKEQNMALCWPVIFSASLFHFQITPPNAREPNTAKCQNVEIGTE